MKGKGKGMSETQTENTVDVVAFTGENFVVQDDSVWFKVELNGSPVFNMVDIMPVVQAKIESGKKPAGVLAKEVGKIVLQSARLTESVNGLFAIYDRMTSTAPRQRTSAAYKARYTVLDGMKNKMLKEYAAMYIPDEVDEYILSDSEDRDRLITRLCEVLVEEKESDEGESEG